MVDSKCPKCSGRMRTKDGIVKLPHVIVIQLKRFDNSDFPIFHFEMLGENFALKRVKLPVTEEFE